MLDPTVIFEDKTHTYWYGSGLPGSDTRHKMESVTSLWGKLGEPFDKELNTACVALSEIIGHTPFWRSFFDSKRHIRTEKDLLLYFHYAVDKTYPIRKAALALEWELAADRGTELHNYIENKIYKKGKYKNPFTKEVLPVVKFPKDWDNQSIVKDLSNLKDGVYPELIVWHHKANMCGQADLVIIYTVKGVRYVDIIDHKTNGGHSIGKGTAKREKIIAPYGDKKMKYPVSHLIDCTHTQYQGQLSTYAYMLELHGFKVGNLALAHYLNFDPKNYIYIHFKYLSYEMPEIFDMLILNNTNK